MNILKRYFYAPSLFILTFLWLHSAAPAQIAAAEKSTYGLSGSCYADMNASGGFDDGDQVIDNATVTVSRLVLGFFLIPVAAQQTGADGTYAFTDLKRGFYRAECRPEIDAEPVTTNPAILLLGFLKPERTLDFGFEAAAEDVMPVTVSIDADPLHIASGESAVLSWSSEYAGRVTIDNGIGEVEPSGSLTVYQITRPTRQPLSAQKGWQQTASPLRYRPRLPRPSQPQPPPLKQLQPPPLLRLQEEVVADLRRPRQYRQQALPQHQR